MNLTNTTLLALNNNSIVNISAALNNNDAGALFRVAGGSVFKMTGGSLASFGTGTNTLNISNPTALANCGCSPIPLTLSGVPSVFILKNGALAANVTVSPGFAANAFTGLGPGNTVNFSGNGAAFIVDGATSKVILQ
jgi:hypothetical protein